MSFLLRLQGFKLSIGEKLAQLMKTVGCLLGTYLLVQSTVSVQPFQYYLNRRRITTKEEAKVVAAVWGTELIQFIVALAIFHRDDFEDKDE